MLNTVIQGDCLDVLQRVPVKSIDMILCDLPYGTTSCSWDSIIPFKPLWVEYERVIKDNGAIVLTASQPFTSALVMSNPKLFKYEIIWEKDKASNFMNAKKRAMKYHENVVIFYKKQPTYNSQKVFVGKPYNKNGKKWRETATNISTEMYGSTGIDFVSKSDEYRHPKSIVKFNTPKHNDKVNGGCFHPTQKPVDMFEWLIKTYTNEGDVVLDNCLGSGTTAVAAINTSRNFIGIEREPEYVAIARRRIDEALALKNND